MPAHYGGSNTRGFVVELNGKHVVVTGGSRGIGENMAREFARRGAKVTIVARNVDALNRVAAEINGKAVVADLTDDSVVDTLIENIERDHGPIDVLVNNAGLETSTAFAVEDDREIRTVSRVNFEVPLMLTRHVLPGMLARKIGHIVFVSSLAGTAGFPGMSVYGGTKAGILNFVNGLSRELKATNVNITVLSPGPVNTDMWDAIEDRTSSVQDVVKRFQKLQLIPTADPVKIARRTVNAVAKNKPFVRDPKRLSINFWLNHLPTRIANLAAIGIKFDPLDKG
jgi:short-subunit dehydrogenase